LCYLPLGEFTGSTMLAAGAEPSMRTEARHRLVVINSEGIRVRCGGLILKMAIRELWVVGRSRDGIRPENQSCV
jgi:hypothetical protein